MNLATIGLMALWAGVTASVISLVLSLLAQHRLARAGLIVGAGFAGVATALLTFALLTSDFSLEYVVRTTSLATPWPYRVAALWGAMEGSILFYATLTIGFGVFAMGRLPDRVRTGAGPVVATVGGGLLLLTGLMANPFVTLDIPAVDGEGLTAILQHPAMVYHPPILYLGLTSLVVPFAIGVSAMMRRQADDAWILLTRRWLLVSWTFLAFGMVAGANWAYVELGWGGFWAWDPVENTSLMPWLAATVFLHTSRVQLRTGRFLRWNAVFAMLPFVLTILGVYLTRSGVTGSVHAFAESAQIGRVLLTLFLLVAIATAWVVSRVPPGPPWTELHVWGRDTWLAGSGGLVALILVFVFVGSAYPAFLAVFGDVRASMDSTYFITLILPIAFLLLVGLALSMQTSWNGKVGMVRELCYLGGTTVAGLGLAGVLFGWDSKWGFFLLALSLGGLAQLVSHLWRVRARGRILAGYLAHIGMVLVLVGGAGSSLGDEAVTGLAPGDVLEVGGYQVRLDGVETGEEDRIIYVAATLTLLRNGAVLDEVVPQIRAYEDQALPIPEPVLRTTPIADIVFAISRVNQDASGVEVSVFVRPLVAWVWVGGLLMAVAGVVALTARGEGASKLHRPATGMQPRRETTTAS